jgi:hypothetical protein
VEPGARIGIASAGRMAQGASQSRGTNSRGISWELSRRNSRLKGEFRGGRSPDAMK